MCISCQRFPLSTANTGHNSNNMNFIQHPSYFLLYANYKEKCKFVNIMIPTFACFYHKGHTL